jgi:dihydroorotase
MGMVIEPERGRDEVKDFILHNVRLLSGEKTAIVVSGGRIIDIAPQLPADAAGCRMDGREAYVSSGWIDLHVHADAALEPYGDEIDEIGIAQGVATIVDAGSCGADRIGGLHAASEKALTNVLALLNVSHIGLTRTDELSQLAWLNEQLLGEAAKRYGEFIVGLKARVSSSVVKEQGIEPLRLARGFADRLDLPLMLHIGSGPPSITEILPYLRGNDMITHAFNGKANGLFDEHGRAIPELVAARERGVLLDVGHGTASFSFKVAERARAAGIAPDTISTDIYRGNRLHGPVYSMAHTLDKFLLLGYSLEETIARVTSRPASWLKRPELGRIQKGDIANLTIFSVQDEKVSLTDSEGETRLGMQHIRPEGVVVNGKYIAI